MTHLTAPRRRIERIFLHCSASDIPIKGSGLVDEIRRWHLARGWKDIGYHFVIDKLGGIYPGRPLEKLPAAQVHYNDLSIAICVHGFQEYTPESLAACRDLCLGFWYLYAGAVTFHGHCEVSAKSCPVFDYKGLLGLDDGGRIRPAPPPRPETVTI